MGRRLCAAQNIDEAPNPSVCCTRAVGLIHDSPIDQEHILPTEALSTKAGRGWDGR
jgi:hypothetical protein